MTDNDEDKTAPAVRTIRTSPRAWDAWGRVLARRDTNRTERIHDVMRSDIEEGGTEEDRADLAAGQAAQEEAAARKRLGRLPTPSAPSAPREPDGQDPSAEDPEEVQEAAMRYAREHFPHTPAAHRAAFANAVCEAVTGWTGGWGGPRVREHAAARTLHRSPRPTYNEAVQQLADPNGVIFGPITALHHECWSEEHCFDDAEDDVATLVL